MVRVELAMSRVLKPVSMASAAATKIEVASTVPPSVFIVELTLRN
jgi:hypothetical protein